MNEDNTGFINFPNPNNPKLVRLETGKTFVYIVSFHPQDISNKAYTLSKVHLFMPGSFAGDDMIQRSKSDSQMTIDDLIENGKKNDEYDSLYFPNKDDAKKLMSIPMVSSICVGWSENTYELKDHIGSWVATFRDLTHEGRKLYYSMKKLHNTKEVRILTFNNI